MARTTPGWQGRRTKRRAALALGRPDSAEILRYHRQMHEAELINLAIVAGAALICGLVMSRLRQPVIVGYILAGVVLGPSVLGLVDEGAEVGLIAELGILMLLFLIGMELSLRNFRRIWRLALTVAGLQIALGLGFAGLAAYLFGWSTELAVIVGFGLGLSSTAVAIKILEDIGDLRSDVGRLAVGVLVAQDLAVVPMLLIVNEMGRPDASLVGALTPVGIAIAVLAVIVFLLSRRKREHLPFAHWLTDNSDLAAMTGLALCFVCAAVSGIAGLSPAYGAFVGGLVLGNTVQRAKIVPAVHPVQSVLLMVFFLSIGLLIDVRFVWQNIGVVLAVLLAVTLAKTAGNIVVFRMLGEPWPRAWLAGTVIGQVGEFSFILVSAGVSGGVITSYGGDLMTSVIALSLVASPFFLFTARRMERVSWRRVRTLADLFGAVYGKDVGSVVARSGAVATGAARITLSMGDYGRNELDRMFQRLRPKEDGEAADDGDASMAEEGGDRPLLGDVDAVGRPEEGNDGRPPAGS